MYTEIIGSRGKGIKRKGAGAAKRGRRIPAQEEGTVF